MAASVHRFDKDVEYNRGDDDTSAHDGPRGHHLAKHQIGVEGGERDGGCGRDVDNRGRDPFAVQLQFVRAEDANDAVNVGVDADKDGRYCGNQERL